MYAAASDFAHVRPATLFLRIWSVLVVAYVIAGLGLVGVPGLSRLAFVSMVVMLVFVAYGYGVKKVRLHRWIVWPVFLYVYFVWLALLGGVDSVGSLQQVTTAWIGATLVGLALSNGVSLRPLVYAMLVAGAMNVAAGYLGFDISEQVMERLELRPDAQTRLTGLAGNANLLAVQLIAPLFLVYLAPSTLISKRWKLIGAGIATYALVVSGSRKAVVMLIVFALFYVLYQYLSGRRVSLFKSVLALLVSVTLVGFVFLSPIPDLVYSLDLHAIDRFFYILEGRDNSYLYRQYLISRGPDLFWESPIYGHGLNMFRYVSGTGAYAHNNYVELMVNGGVIALILHYVVHLIVLYRARNLPKNIKLAVYTSIAMLLFLDVAMVSYNLRVSVLWLVVLLAFVSSSSQTKSKVS
jgi:hypothetical protein